MRRWTDGKSWSASRVSGSFLTYREMEGKRGGSAVPTAPVAKRASGKSPDGSGSGDSEGEGPDGYRYKPDGLMKQSFSITTQSGQHLHLISYYSRSNSNNLPQPTNDAQLRHIRPPKNMYPESAVNETQTVPAVTRGPMPGSPYSAPGHSMAPSSPYTRGGPVAPMYAVPVYPPTPPNGTPPLYYSQHPYFYPGVIYAQPQYHPQHVFDRPPPPIAHPHAPQGHHPMLMQHPAYAAHAAHAAQQYTHTFSDPVRPHLLQRPHQRFLSKAPSFLPLTVLLLPPQVRTSHRLQSPQTSQNHEHLSQIAQPQQHQDHFLHWDRSLTAKIRIRTTKTTAVQAVAALILQRGFPETWRRNDLLRTALLQIAAR
jgi:hypothetical protein